MVITRSAYICRTLVDGFAKTKGHPGTCHCYEEDLHDLLPVGRGAELQVNRSLRRRNSSRNAFAIS